MVVRCHVVADSLGAVDPRFNQDQHLQCHRLSPLQACRPTCARVQLMHRSGDQRACTDHALRRVVWAARRQRGLLVIHVYVRLSGHLVPLLAIELELTTKHLPHEKGGRRMHVMCGRCGSRVRNEEGAARIRTSSSTERRPAPAAVKYPSTATYMAASS